MAWYAYCITEQAAFQGLTRVRRAFPVEGLKGVSGAQVFGYPSGEFAVIVSEHAPGGKLDQRAVIEHAHVISECFRTTTVLPFRFGTVFDNEDALRRAVRANHKTFLETVSRLRGKSEMHVKVMLRDESPALVDVELPAVVGAEYLTRLRQKAAREREQQTKARAVSLQVHKLFNPLDEDISCKKVDSGAIVLDIAHLIDSSAVEKYQNRCSTVARQLREYEVSISGPWPPYHFMPEKVRTVSGKVGTA